MVKRESGMGHWGLGMKKRQGRQGRGGRQGRDYSIIPPCPPCPPCLPHLPHLPHLPLLLHPHLPTPLFNRIALIAFWTRQGSRVPNFFKCYKNVVEVTTIIADSRCHPN